MKKIIIDNHSDLDNILAMNAAKIHMIDTDSQFCDLKVGNAKYVSVKHRNKNSIRFAIYNQPA